MALATSVDCGTLKIITDDSAITANVFSQSPLQDSWQEIDLSEYIPKGSKGARLCVDAETLNANVQFIYSFTIDTSTAVTALYYSRGHLFDATGANIARDTYIIDVLVNSNRKVWIAAYNTGSWETEVKRTTVVGYWI